MYRLSLYLWFSFLFHLTILSGMWIFGLFAPVPRNISPQIKAKQIQVEILKKYKKDKKKEEKLAQKQLIQKKIVLDNHAARTDKPSPKAQVLSDANRQTQQESINTQAKIWAPTHSELPQNLSPKSQKDIQAKSKASKAERGQERHKDQVSDPHGIIPKLEMKDLFLSENEVNQKPIERESEQASLADLGALDYLKNLKVNEGPETQLNSAQFLFYGYFVRFKIQLYQNWVSSIPEKMQKMFFMGRNIASKTERSAIVKFTLDELGQLASVELIQSSGFEELDDAALEAFKKAAPFPNPPEGLLNQEKQFTSQWVFIYES